MMKKFFCLTVLFVFLFPFTVFAVGTFVYDANGNLIKDDAKIYEYNQANKLVRVRQGTSGTGPVLAEYFYDFNGQRIKKIENEVTTYYIGKHYEEEYTAGVQTGNAGYYFANGQRIAKKDGAGKLSFFHADHLGGTNAVSDANGNLTERTKYYPFGDIREGGQKDRYSFTGKEKDKATDFYYFEARYYNPGYRHFTQADVIVPNAYDPQSLNRYAYVKNNPMKYIDPSGNGEEKPGLTKTVYCTIHQFRPKNVSPEGKLKLIEKNKYIDEKNRIWYLEPDERSVSHQDVSGISKEEAEEMVKKGESLPNKKFISMHENGISSYEAVLKDMIIEKTGSETFIHGEWVDERIHSGPSFNYFQPSGKFGSNTSIPEGIAIILLDYNIKDFAKDSGHWIFDMHPYDSCK